MKIIYLFIKSKDDFCQNTKQFIHLFSSNTRLVFDEHTHTIKADHKILHFTMDSSEVKASNEIIFQLTLDAKQEKAEEQIAALESADVVFRRMNDKLGDFKINTVWDDVSMYYGKKLYPRIVEIESLLREIIYLFMLKNIGSRWLMEKSPKEVKDSIEKTMEKNMGKGAYPDTDALIYADFITLGGFFFSKYALKSDYQKLLEQLKKTENQTAEKIDELVEQYETKSNWDRYFADKLPIDYLSDKWNRLYGYRNQVAHTKKISKEDYTEAGKILDELKPTFIECLELLSQISMTEEQSDAVEEVAEQTIAPKSVYSQDVNASQSLSVWNHMPYSFYDKMMKDYRDSGPLSYDVWKQAGNLLLSDYERYSYDPSKTAVSVTASPDLLKWTRQPYSALKDALDQVQTRQTKVAVNPKNRDTQSCLGNQDIQAASSITGEEEKN